MRPEDRIRLQHIFETAEALAGKTFTQTLPV
jgi:hypothetical protein